MKNYGMKFGLILALTIFGVVSIWPPKEKLKTGIDLSGGTILVYAVNTSAVGAGNFKIDELITALKRRINPEGVLDIPIRNIGTSRIEVILPKATSEKVEEVKRKMTNVGSLEFRILANHKTDASAIERAMSPKGLVNPPPKYRWAKLGETYRGNNPTIDPEGKALTDPAQRWVKNSLAGRTIYLTGKNTAGTEQTDLAIPIEANTINTIQLKQPVKLSTISSYRIEYNPSRITANRFNPSNMDPIIREVETPGHVERFILYKVDRQNVTGKELAKVNIQQDDHFQNAVGFNFTRKGGRLFGALTSEHLPEENGAFKYQLAIILDNVVQSAPSINSEIRSSGIIEGGAQGFSKSELDFLITVLRSGSLPASLNPEPLQEVNVGPTLGEDTIAKGVFAIVVSLIVVPVFMMIYYRFAGVVAVVALLLNLLLLLASMVYLDASFTLPGLAGLALTIGMAVDVNVLIFERMREEAERGASMAQQIRNGFDRAWVTIFDSHVTIFLSGLVLYLVGTDEVKGFALTLIIGMIWNLFTAVYVSRLIFEFWYDQGWLKKVTMLKLLDKTKIDFIGPRKICMRVSAVLIVLGLVATFARGKGMYNIDFTGGTLVTIRLNSSDPKIKDMTESQRTSYVRKSVDLPDVTVESLTIGNGKAGESYNIRTTEQKLEVVKKTVREAFGSALQRVILTAGQAKPIAGPDPAKPEPKETTDKFAGGRSYDLTFNLPQSAAQIENTFANVLQDARIDNPKAQFEIINPNAI
jgi:SecD/SecF fusion protein